MWHTSTFRYSFYLDERYYRRVVLIDKDTQEGEHFERQQEQCGVKIVFYRHHTPVWWLLKCLAHPPLSFYILFSRNLKAITILPSTVMAFFGIRYINHAGLSIFEINGDSLPNAKLIRIHFVDS